MSGALIVFSGGQDSTTCLYWAKHQGYDPIHLLTFGYGQRHIWEIKAAETIGKMAKVASHEFLNLGPILKSTSPLVNLDGKVGHYNGVSSLPGGVEPTFIPGRNILFLTIAANRAAHHEVDAVILGITAADFANLAPVDWEWFAGFFDAEGCVSISRNKKVSKKPVPRLSVSQNEPEIIYKIKELVKTIGITSHVVRRADGTCFGLQIDYTKNVVPIVEKISKHMHHQKKRNKLLEVLTECNINPNVISDEADLTWDWITGFWEGDGSIGRESYNVNDDKRWFPVYSFWQIDTERELLERIQTFFGKGSVRKDGKGGLSLAITEKRSCLDIFSEMKGRVRLLKSREKMTKKYLQMDISTGAYSPAYPDCSPDFLHGMQKALDEGIGNSIECVAPVLYKTKSQEVLLAAKLPGCMKALAYSHTCYDNEYPPNPHNHASLLRAKGFAEAGLPDPLILRAKTESLLPEDYPDSGLVENTKYAL